MRLRPRRPGWHPDGQRLLGALLPRARDPARRADALRQGRGRRLDGQLGVSRDGGVVLLHATVMY